MTPNKLRMSPDLVSRLEQCEAAKVPIPAGYVREVISAIQSLEAENADLKAAVIAFGAPHMVEWAEALDLPKGHLHPKHYDLLESWGARMDEFTRASLDTEGEDRI